MGSNINLSNANSSNNLWQSLHALADSNMNTEQTLKEFEAQASHAFGKNITRKEVSYKVYEALDELSKNFKSLPSELRNARRIDIKKLTTKLQQLHDHKGNAKTEQSSQSVIRRPKFTGTIKTISVKESLLSTLKANSSDDTIRTKPKISNGFNRKLLDKANAIDVKSDEKQHDWDDDWQHDWDDDWEVSEPVPVKIFKTQSLHVIDPKRKHVHFAKDVEEEYGSEQESPKREIDNLKKEEEKLKLEIEELKCEKNKIEILNILSKEMDQMKEELRILQNDLEQAYAKAIVLEKKEFESFEVLVKKFDKKTQKYQSLYNLLGEFQEKNLDIEKINKIIEFYRKLFDKDVNQNNNSEESSIIIPSGINPERLLKAIEILFQGNPALQTIEIEGTSHPIPRPSEKTLQILVSTPATTVLTEQAVLDENQQEIMKLHGIDRQILMRASPYFKALWTGGFQETNLQKPISLAVSPVIFKSLLEILYSPQKLDRVIEDPQVDILELLSIAHKLQLTSIEELLLEKFKLIIIDSFNENDLNNIKHIYEFACQDETYIQLRSYCEQAASEWLLLEISNEKEFKRKVEAIKNLEITRLNLFFFKYRKFFNQKNESDLLEDKHLKWLKPLDLEKLYLDLQRNITDEGLAHYLKGKINLKRLDLEYCPKIKGSFLIFLKDMKLNRLNLKNSGIKDTYLTYFSKLSIEWLDLTLCSITDEGLKRLGTGIGTDKGLKKLVKQKPPKTMLQISRLDLAHCRKITKDGLVFLKELPLKYLDVSHSGLNCFHHFEVLKGKDLEVIRIAYGEYKVSIKWSKNENKWVCFDEFKPKSSLIDEMMDVIKIHEKKTENLEKKLKQINNNNNNSN